LTRLNPRRAAAAIAIAAPLVLGGFILGRHSADGGYRVFQAVMSIVSRDALDSLTTDKIYENAARGVVAGLDDAYADLYSAEEYARFNRNQLGNRYGGVGLRITPSQGGVMVFRVIDGGPAAAAGVQHGDRLVAVDDSSAQSWTTDRASSALTGTPGTTVRATFERLRTHERYTVNLTRAVISVPAVNVQAMLEGNVGYIQLRVFSDRSAGDVRTAVQSLQAAGAQSLVLDLRGNPGGSLDQAVALTSVFLDPGQPVVRVRSRRDDDTLRAVGPTVARAGLPIAVMIDGNSASASEIVAGALQDYDRALLVGTTSYGKGLVQGGYPLPDGWVLKLTTAHWYTPSGRLIQRVRADSLHPRPDTTRPVFRSAAGRQILGGGGITPDLAVGGDTLTPAEVAVGRLLNAKTQATNDVLDSYVSELEPQATPGYAFRPAWLGEFEHRLAAAGVTIPDSLQSSGARYLERLLDGRLANFALSDSSAFVRAAPRDAQLQRALDRLRRAHSQHELFALAAEPRRN